MIGFGGRSGRTSGILERAACLESILNVSRAKCAVSIVVAGCDVEHGAAEYIHVLTSPPRNRRTCLFENSGVFGNTAPIPPNLRHTHKHKHGLSCRQMGRGCVPRVNNPRLAQRYEYRRRSLSSRILPSTLHVRDFPLGNRRPKIKCGGGRIHMQVLVDITVPASTSCTMLPDEHTVSLNEAAVVANTSINRLLSCRSC